MRTKEEEPGNFRAMAAELLGQVGCASVRELCYEEPIVAGGFWSKLFG